MTNTEMAIKRIEERIDELNTVAHQAPKGTPIAEQGRLAKCNRIKQWIFGALEMMRILDSEHWYTLRRSEESGEYELRVTE